MSKIYAVVGTNAVTVVADTVRYNPQANEVLMKSERPSEGDYIANADGEWVEDKAKKLAELDNQYDKDKAEIIKYYSEAIFAEDTETMADLKEEMAEIDAKYKANRKAIEEGREE